MCRLEPFKNIHRWGLCSNCGEKLNSADLEYPKCHTVIQQPTTHKEATHPIVEHLPYKSPGTAGILAFIGGVFSLLGIGHIYVGKVRRGIIMMICGLVLVVILAIFVGILSGLSADPSSSTNILPPSTDIPSPSTSDLAEDSIFQGGMIYVTIFTLALAVGYFVLFIWQLTQESMQDYLMKRLETLVRNLGN